MKVDISHHQGRIDWKILKKSVPTLDGVYIKASQGVGYVDPLCTVNAIGAFSQNIPIGYYHFASLNTTTNIVKDAVAEADYFNKTVKGLKPHTLPLVLDIEENKAGLNRDQVLMWINTFIERMKALGNSDLAIYSYTPFLNTNLPPKHNLGGVPLWIAHYTSNSLPTIPKGWKKAWLWQYSSTGKLPGIIGNVDLNKTL